MRIELEKMFGSSFLAGNWMEMRTIEMCMNEGTVVCGNQFQFASKHYGI